MSRQWKGLALRPHSDFVRFSPSDFHRPDLLQMSQKYHSKNQNIMLKKDLLILNIKQKHSKSIVWMFNQWDLCTINIPTIFLKKRNRFSRKIVQRDRKISSKCVDIEQVVGLTKTFKMPTLALNRTETKLTRKVSFAVVQFQTMNYSTI